MAHENVQRTANKNVEVGSKWKKTLKSFFKGSMVF